MGEEVLQLFLSAAPAPQLPELRTDEVTSHTSSSRTKMQISCVACVGEKSRQGR